MKKLVTASLSQTDVTNQDC